MSVKSLSMMKKILIANRGEIACRVMRTAKRLGIRTVAVFSDADVDSLHVKMADEAFYIGPPQAQESYLRGDKIIDVAKQANALGIHPGYGFLSENVEFAELCQKEGIIFIGPPSSAIRDMGIKSTSKSIMEAAGVATVPGYHGDNQDIHFLEEKANEIGFPVMIKAVRGGGGKGMRIAHTKEDFQAALESAKRESLRAFNDDNVLLEKYIGRPRHVEVQVFGDKHGNYVHLFERDCSVQRRHQKVIEQAPAPGVDNKLRLELGEAGVRAARAVNYVGAGTVEFIFDTNENKFYFMEMNTRLQVEHPITEMITGVDLVEWQLRVASGEKIPLRQEEITLKGSSVEARIYAEDILGGFLPTAGHLDLMSTPSGENIRVETGVTSGDDVSVHYDPMIAKLVVWSPQEETSLSKMVSALGEFNIVGVENNVDFLRRLCLHNDLIKGNVHTGFIDEHKNSLMPTPPNDIVVIKAALSVILREIARTKEMAFKSVDKFNPFSLEGPFRLNHEHKRVVKLLYQEKEYNVVIKSDINSEWMKAKVNDSPEVKVKGKIETKDGFSYVTFWTPQDVSSMKIGHSKDDLFLFCKDGNFKIGMKSEDLGGDFSQSEGSLSQAVSPMPGVVEKIIVKNGDTVKKGDPVAVVIAMKMEHVIKAEMDGTVESVLFQAGQNVGKNMPIVKFATKE